jgi:hypothetical protein
MRRLAFAFLVVAAVSPTEAQIIGDPRCKSVEYTSARIDEVGASLRRVADAIETVPPADAEYIKNEVRLALQEQSEARFNAVASSRYFRALEFHDHYKVAFDNLRAARQSRSKEQARYLVVVLSRMADLGGSMKDYIEFDARRQTPHLTSDRKGIMYFNMPAAKDRLVSLLQCVIEQI